ncbi:MAG: class I SAM-dependent methyltransferase [Acidimicrobiia bacterium]|nr:class I SAM-dependent methyltransferase [Acidimicrobiia bacterium]MCY4456581.1 class I SAM-dependent methyltransferase [Acidimicrobiaceae bacterium]
MASVSGDALERVWEPARASGSLGSATFEELNNHAKGYIPNTFELPAHAQCVDLGTGVGVPGVLLALQYPDTNWRLLDANAKRCEIADRAVRAVSLTDRVTVVHGRAEDYAHEATWRSSHDLVVARSFGPPAELAECALPLLVLGGSLILSVSSETAAVWKSGDLSELAGVVVASWATPYGRYIRVQREDEYISASLPRRQAARRRNPLF